MRSRVLMTIAATVLLAWPAAAQPGPGRMGRGYEGRGAPGEGPMMGHMRIPDLSAQQRADIAALMAQHRESMGAAFEQMRGLHQQLNEAIYADTPDAGAIEQLKAQIATAEATALAARIDLQTRIAQVLTPEQRKELRERPKREGPGRRGPRARG